MKQDDKEPTVRQLISRLLMLIAVTACGVVGVFSVLIESYDEASAYFLFAIYAILLDANK